MATFYKQNIQLTSLNSLISLLLPFPHTHTQTHTLGYSEYTPHSMRSSYYHNSHANRWNKFINSSHHTLARALIHLYCTQYTLANTLVRQARTNTHLRLMTMDIMYETVQHKAHTVYSLFAVFCCFFSLLFYLAFYMAFISHYYYGFFFPVSIHRVQFIPIKLFMLFLLHAIFYGMCIQLFQRFFCYYFLFFLYFVTYFH